MSEPNQTVQPDEMGEQQLSELLQIRRDKLQALREGRTVGEEVILPVTLVVRGSTRIRK